MESLRPSRQDKWLSVGEGAFVEVHHADVEERSVDNLCCTSDGVAVIGAVVFLYTIVDGIGCQFRMQLTRLSVKSRAVVVVEAVGDVAALLHLSQIYAAADGMHASGRDEEDVSGVYLMACQGIDDGAVGNATLIFLG